MKLTRRRFLLSTPGLVLPAAGARLLTPRPGRTPVAAGPPLRRIAFGACLDQRLPQPIWDAVLAADPGLFVFMGDNVYGDVFSPGLKELREAYALQARNPGFRRLRDSVPVEAVWDDHDYGLNDGGASFAGRAGAQTLFADFWRLPADDPRRRRPGIYHARTYGPPGRRVQIVMLDTRYFRSPLRHVGELGRKGHFRYVPDPDPAKTMLGEAQWAWLAGVLKEEVELRLIVSSIQVLAQGHDFERWETMPRERDRLLALIGRSAAAQTVILSGDRHHGAIYRLDHVSTPLYEITSSSLNRPSFRRTEPGPHRLGEIYGLANFGLLSIDWDRDAIALELRDVEGRPVRTQPLTLTAQMHHI